MDDLFLALAALVGSCMLLAAIAVGGQVFDWRKRLKCKRLERRLRKAQT